MTDDSLVVVFDAPDAAQATLYCAMLEEAGFTVIERSLEVPGYPGVLQRWLYSQLLVPHENAEEARKLVEAFHEEIERGELNADELPPEDEGESEGTP